MDMLMKSLDEGAIEKKEVIHIHDSHMTCEECGESEHLGNNCPELQEGVKYSSSTTIATIVLNRIKAGINNKDLITHIIIKVIILSIISINPFERVSFQSRKVNG